MVLNLGLGIDAMVEQVKNVLMLLWDNSSLNGEWRLWAEMYRRVVRALAEMQGGTCPC